MAMLVRNIDEFFYEYKKDLYLIKFRNNEPDKSPISFTTEEEREPDGKQEIVNWIKENLPKTTVMPIFPFSYDSGILCEPYDGSIALLWDEHDRDKFEKTWENQNGSSKDPRFQLFWYPLELYKQ